MQARKPRSRPEPPQAPEDSGATATTRYRTIADDLRSEITNGRYPIGAALPTEAELCRRHSVSRHTVREALRRLVDLGLIERRQGAGSRVVSATPKTGYLHTIRSLQELFEYTRDTRLEIAEMTTVAIDEDEAEIIPAPVGSRWIRITGVRWSADRGEAICHSVVLVHSRFAGALTVRRGDDARALLADDPFARIHPARIVHVEAGVFGTVPPATGPTIERHGSARPWPWDRFA